MTKRIKTRKPFSGKKRGFPLSFYSLGHVDEIPQIEDPTSNKNTTKTHHPYGPGLKDRSDDGFNRLKKSTLEILGRWDLTAYVARGQAWTAIPRTRIAVIG